MTRSARAYSIGNRVVTWSPTPKEAAVLLEDADNLQEIGVCPYCLNADDLLHIGPHHFVVCWEHRCSWFVPYELFGDWGWDEQTEEHRARSARILADLSPVIPVMLPDPDNVLPSPDDDHTESEGES
jgi:hypothetical protein